MIRVGIGYDVHPFQKGRDLILGGVNIPYSKGLAGHSDADVLTHAVCDAILGALGLGDMGTHFPDSDPNFRGVSSLSLLEKVMEHVRKEGFYIQYLDTVVIAEEPKLASFKEQIRSSLAKILNVNERHINIKATTQDGLGFIGRVEGMAAQAVCTLANEE